jgi:hypothetical protein
MCKTILSLLNKPYPFNDDLKHNSKIIFFISLGVFAFLFLFQPFEIGLLPIKERYYLIIGFSLITFFSLSINLLFIPSQFPKKFVSSDWNIKKEILWNLWILFTILTGFFFFTKTLGIMKFNFEMVLMMLLTAILPLSFLIIINHNNMLRLHLKLANEINKKLKDIKEVQEKIIYFTSDYQKDSLAVKVSSLLVIRSANNYIEVFWKEGNTARNQMVRCSMAKAEELVKDYKFIFKCHRSYMANINYFDKIEGNSLGYKLICEYINFPIPVSKIYADKLKEII